MDHPATRRGDGFHERGAQTTRLEAFVDAAFAFAVTLLVIAVDAVPSSVTELLTAVKGIPAFAASFALIAMFWYAHNKWSRRFGLDDGVSIALSLFLVFLVLVYVYPLKMMFGSFFNFISNGYVPAGFHARSADDVLAMFVIYAVAYATMGIVIMLLYAHAYRARARLHLDDEEIARTWGEIWRWAMVPFSGALSLAIVAVLPAEPTHWQVAMAGMVYFVMTLSGVVETAAIRSARRRLAARHA